MTFKLLRFLTGVWMAMMPSGKQPKRPVALRPPEVKPGRPQGVNLPPAKTAIFVGCEEAAVIHHYTIQVTSADGGVTVEIATASARQSVFVRTCDLRKIAFALRNGERFWYVNFDNMLWAEKVGHDRLNLIARTWESPSDEPEASIDIGLDGAKTLAWMILDMAA